MGWPLGLGFRVFWSSVDFTPPIFCSKTDEASRSPPPDTPKRPASSHIRYRDISESEEAKDGFKLNENAPFLCKITKGHPSFEVMEAKLDAISARVAQKAEMPGQGAGQVFDAWQEACPKLKLKNAREETTHEDQAVLDVVVASVDHLHAIIKQELPADLVVDEVWCASFEDVHHMMSDGVTRSRLGHGFRAGVTSGQTIPHQDRGDHTLTTTAFKVLKDGPSPANLTLEFELLSDEYVFADDGPFPPMMFGGRGTTYLESHRRGAVVKRRTYAIDDPDAIYVMVIDPAANARWLHSVVNPDRCRRAFSQEVADRGLGVGCMMRAAGRLEAHFGPALKPTEIVDLEMTPATKKFLQKDRTSAAHSGLPLPDAAQAEAAKAKAEAKEDAKVAIWLAEFRELEVEAEAAAKEAERQAKEDAETATWLAKIRELQAEEDAMTAAKETERKVEEARLAEIVKLHVAAKEKQWDREEKQWDREEKQWDREVAEREHEKLQLQYNQRQLQKPIEFGPPELVELQYNQRQLQKPFEFGPPELVELAVALRAYVADKRDTDAPVTSWSNLKTRKWPLEYALNKQANGFRCSVAKVLRAIDANLMNRYGDIWQWRGGWPAEAEE